MSGSSSPRLYFVNFRESGCLIPFLEPEVSVEMIAVSACGFLEYSRRVILS